MKISVPKETKPDEYRVALTPSGVVQLVTNGHDVFVEAGAGVGSGFFDQDYVSAGATITKTASDAFKCGEMIVKVKEPQADEIAKFTHGQIVLTYFHFAASIDLTQGCIDRGIVAIAYETIRDDVGRLPCLTPMSEIAGKMSIQEGARCLERPFKGRGILLGGVPGVAPAKVVILGAGVVGANAAKIAAGMGATVVLMDISLERLRYLADIMPANVTPIYCDSHTIRDHLRDADLVIGAVLIPGSKSPKLVAREDITLMNPGAVIVDVAIDQGGCFETSRPTTHKEPTYTVDDIVHYCVTNMPGAVSRTSTIALSNATLPYVVQIANHGYERAAESDPGLGEGISLVCGRVTDNAVASSHSLKYEPQSSA